MRLEIQALLFDMQQACGLIAGFVAGKNFQNYMADVQCRSAVERQFTIVGEALNRLTKIAPDIAIRIPEHRTIIDFRNILVHSYDRVKQDVVWGIAQAHLPTLQDTVNRLLTEQEDVPDNA